MHGGNKYYTMEYYDGAKLLSMKDIDGETPEIFLCTTNRSGGKTTYFNRLAVNRFKANKIRKFMLLYRFNYELSEVHDKFFKDIKALFYPADEMTSAPRARGVFTELFLNGVSCAYAVAINQADQIKKYSHLLSDTDMMLFDEFQSETNHYCSNEVQKFISIHDSIARGQGKQSRYVPVYMIGNPVTLLNPYYAEFDICSRLNNNTRFVRGHGFVLEQGFVESAANAQRGSRFHAAFNRNKYVQYSSEGLYLNDNKAFIEKPQGTSKYLGTLRYNNKEYAIREYRDAGIIYCDDTPDATYPFKIAVTTDDHQINYVMLKANDFFLSSLRYFFEKGAFRFKDLACKEAIIKALSY